MNWDTGLEQRLVKVGKERGMEWNGREMEGGEEERYLLYKAWSLNNLFLQHDPTECQPSGDEGNYIMFEHTTDAGHPNNDRFSECSIHDMRQVIEAKAHYCFTGKSSGRLKIIPFKWENVNEYVICMIMLSTYIYYP